MATRKNNKIRIVFLGTPKFAVPYLESLIDNDFEIVGVITQPDRPTGRQQIISQSAVKETAIKHQLKIFQPEKLKTDIQLRDDLNALKPDLMVVVAYGQIIPKEILDIAKLGNINVHPSLLPKYRGASPIQNAILNNETTTGLTIMLVDEKMDHGPILAQSEIALDGTETSESLHQKMSDKISTDFLIETINKFINHQITPITQNDDQAIFCKLLTKDEAKINWTDTAKNISAKIRAFYPWPVAWTTLDEKRVKLFPPVTIIDIKKAPGEIFESDKNFAVGGDDHSLIINSLQFEGQNKILAKDSLLGHKHIINKNFK